MSLAVLGIDVISCWLQPRLSIRDRVYAASTCKSMKAIEFSWVYEPKRWYFGPHFDVDYAFFKTLYQLEMNPAMHKPLPLEAYYSNGGEYSETYCFQNITSTEKLAYCTKEPQNVDVYLRLMEKDKEDLDDLLYIDFDGALEDLVMLITEIDIRGSGVGYTSPLDTSVTFFLMDQPQPDQFNSYNGLDLAQFHFLTLNKSMYQLQEQKLPAFFDSYYKRRATENDSHDDSVDTENEEMEGEIDMEINVPAEQTEISVPEEEHVNQKEGTEANVFAEQINHEGMDINVPAVEEINQDEGTEAQNDVEESGQAPAPFNPRQTLNKPSPVCKYIAFKMLSPSGEKTNIDVSYFGVKGVLIDLKKKKQVLHRETKVSDGERRECTFM
eukprot:TRINITY_DN26693_c0_g1_i1.p1 TRINITY_DN26693_c0_g1~~TRINITY_DN26693_c0_g1_i1.p1  ORF type:complete len:383 (-),score=115.49 TRINITY_DN26693_c0_g1_i1:52-1200(-)